MNAVAELSTTRPWPFPVRLPVFAAPMFLVSGPELVVAACRAGIVGAFPTPNCRTAAELDQWMTTITTELATPTGPLHLAQVRASIDVAQKDGATDVYVLAGEVRTDGSARATAGERLTLEPHKGEPTAKTSPVLTWEDWTGGLATTDRSAEPSPYGVGTVGARRPGEPSSPSQPSGSRSCSHSIPSRAPASRRCPPPRS